MQILSYYIITMHYQNVRVVFNFAETVHAKNSQNLRFLQQLIVHMLGKW